METFILGSKNGEVQAVHTLLQQVEGGAALLNHIIASGIYDEVHVEVSDLLLPPSALGKGVKAPDFVLKKEPMIVDGHKVYFYQK